MIPRVSKGRSFKGAGQYYMNAKDKSGKNRVAWTYLHNLDDINDPHKAFGYMAYTAMNAEDLKRQAGTARTGRKSQGRVVYTFALSWSPEQQPTQEHMQSSALNVLAALGLVEHEAVLVSHNDTEHPHVHCIANLVHPETGRMADMKYDYLKLSAWAEEYEKEHGKVYCHQRVENNKERRENAKDGRQLALVKHREEKAQQAELIRHLYQAADSGRAFRAALAEHNLILATGDRRGLVVVDGQGKPHSLFRQLKGHTTADINARLRDAVKEGLPSVGEAAHRQKHFDREHYETERQKALADAAIEESNNHKNGAGEKKKEIRQERTGNASEEYLKRLDAVREAEQQADRRRASLKERQQVFYNRQKTAKELQALKALIEKNQTPFGRVSGVLEKYQARFTALEKSLADMDKRIAEQDGALEKEIANDQLVKKEQQADEKKKEIGIDAAKQRWRERTYNDRQNTLDI